MGTTTANISLYIPSAGETNYNASFMQGMINLDQHDHSGPPYNGVPLSSGGLANFSVTYQKLNSNVAQISTGIGFNASLPNQLALLGILPSIYNGGVSWTGGFAAFNGSTASTHVLSGTSVTVTNGNGASAGNTTFNVSSAYTAANTSKIVQYVTTKINTTITTLSVIPDDDTPPQNTEGAQILTQSITPTNISNLLLIVVEAQIGIDGFADVACGLSLFQDSTADAIQAIQYGGAAGSRDNVNMSYIMTAGTTSSTTFNVRFGQGGSGANLTLNGIASGARKYGGATSSSITIYELLV